MEGTQAAKELRYHHVFHKDTLYHNRHLFESGKLFFLTIWKSNRHTYLTIQTHANLEPSPRPSYTVTLWIMEHACEFMRIYT